MHACVRQDTPSKRFERVTLTEPYGSVQSYGRIMISCRAEPRATFLIMRAREQFDREHRLAAQSPPPPPSPPGVLPFLVTTTRPLDSFLAEGACLARNRVSIHVEPSIMIIRTRKEPSAGMLRIRIINGHHAVTLNYYLSYS